MLNFVETFFRKSRRRLSRSEWLIKLLRLTKAQGAACEPGLVLIQIDGLSRRQLERAVAAGNMPFLAQLLRKHAYELHSLYSGLPSSTPAMTAELLYGVKCAVPSFSYYDRSAGTIVRMFEPWIAKKWDRWLQHRGQPLLVGGSAYAGIYTGGAEETHFCASTTTSDGLFRAQYPQRLFLIVLFSIYSWIWVGVLMVVEFFLALFDCVRGLGAGQGLWKEIKTIPPRVGISILMREMATIGAKIDVTRGLPVIYLNMVGYDERSHRRGPMSRSAHGSLKGIDNAIARIWRAAQRSARRDYDVWVFSDHGSEQVVSYPRKHGRTLEEAISEAFGGTVRAFVGDPDERGIQSERMRAYMRSHQEDGPWADLEQDGEQTQPQSDDPVVAAMGPVGHVYLNRPLEDTDRERLALLLVERAHVPMVGAADGPGRARIWTKEGPLALPEDGPRIFSHNHPFLEEVTQDFITLCHHKHAGDFVLWGWNRGGPSCTFPVENGAHAGPGPEETHAFAVLPVDAPVDRSGKSYLRPLDLHRAALRHLRRDPSLPDGVVQIGAEKAVLRVVTYNVHSCMGIDGKLSPQRIARVIARYRPHIVALQEVDIGRRRTGQADQARIIAECLDMKYQFGATIQLAEEAYGNCVLSWLPMRLVKAGTLPTLPERDSIEPRGALWVEIELDGKTIQFVNTHLGLNAREKFVQVRALLGRHWLGGRPGADPFVLCGDFNASPQSRVWRLCERRFHDVQILADEPPRRTWFGHYPIARIDHIFVNAQVEVVRVDVGDDYLARVASDHRPLFAEIKVAP